MEKLHAVLTASSPKIRFSIDSRPRNVDASLQTGGIGKSAIIRFNSKNDFPSMGNPDTWYIDTSEDLGYIWDTDSITYIPMASDWHQIEVIQGGKA